MYIECMDVFVFIVSRVLLRYTCTWLIVRNAKSGRGILLFAPEFSFENVVSFADANYIFSFISLHWNINKFTEMSKSYSFLRFNCMPMHNRNPQNCECILRFASVSVHVGAIVQLSNIVIYHLALRWQCKFGAREIILFLPASLHFNCGLFFLVSHLMSDWSIFRCENEQPIVFQIIIRKRMNKNRAQKS